MTLPSRYHFRFKEKREKEGRKGFWERSGTSGGDLSFISPPASAPYLPSTPASSLEMGGSLPPRRPPLERPVAAHHAGIPPIPRRTNPASLCTHPQGDTIIRHTTLEPHLHLHTHSPSRPFAYAPFANALAETPCESSVRPRHPRHTPRLQLAPPNTFAPHLDSL